MNFDFCRTNCFPFAFVVFLLEEPEEVEVQADVEVALEAVFLLTFLLEDFVQDNVVVEEDEATPTDCKVELDGSGGGGSATSLISSASLAS